MNPCKHGIVNWKSTVGGFLTIALTTTTALLAFPTLLPPKTVLYLLLGQAIAKGYISLIQTDGGIVLPPGSSVQQTTETKVTTAVDTPTKNE